MTSKESDEKRVTIVIDKNLDYKFRKMASQKFRFEPKWYSKAIILMRILNSFINFNHYIIYYAFNRFYKRDSREW